MKVCFVNLASGFGGGENQTLLLAKELKKEGVELIAVANPKGKLFKKFMELGIPLLGSTNPIVGHFHKFLKDVDCFHAHDGRGVHWCYYQKLISRKPFVVTRRVINPIKKRWLTQRAYSAAAKLIGVSALIQRGLSTAFPSQSCDVIMDSPASYEVDSVSLAALRKRFNHKFVVLQAASLSRHKGFDITIETAKLLSDYPDIQFAFLGEGEEESRLKQQAQGLLNVQFFGRQENMGDWFAVSSCLVLPSRMEGLGSVLLEAMKAHLPVIASNVGGIPEIVKNKETGILISSENSTELSHAILELRGDQELQRIMVEKAYNFVQTIDINIASKKYLEIYKQIKNF